MTREQAEQIAMHHWGPIKTHESILAHHFDVTVHAILHAVAVEREACAKVCEELDSPYWDDLDPVMECAKQIRARGER